MIYPEVIMKRLKFIATALLLASSIFFTGCDATQIVEVINKVAQGVQQAMPAIKQTVEAFQQAFSTNNQNTATPTNANQPVEEKSQNNQAAVNITSPNQENIGTTDSGAAATTAATSGTSAASATNIPSASGAGEAGSAFMTRTANMSQTQKDQAIVDAITSGNMPDFLRNFRDVTVTRRLSDGREHSITYQVMPDYLAIGTNADFVRTPMSSTAAQRIAERFNCILPTTQMVDDIYRSAQTRLTPQTMPPTSAMTSNQYFVDHQRRVEEACRSAGHTNGQLIAGHKKDIVISNRLDRNPGKVAIYGWHRSNGTPIQSLSTVHQASYADYSHGVRLISKTVIVDGREMNIEDVLRDPVLSGLLSNEGPIRKASATR